MGYDLDPRETLVVLGHDSDAQTFTVLYVEQDSRTVPEHGM